MIRLLILSTALFLFGANYVTAQETVPSDTTVVLKKITKHDGVVYIGEILSDDGREILLLTKKLGKIYIPKSDIASIEDADLDKIEVVNGDLREQGPFKTRYYFTNNALPIEKGENYAMVHLYGPEVHFAVTNRLSIGVMATWAASPIGLALKYSIPTNNEKLNLSLGTIMLSSGYINSARGYGGLHWGSITYGSPGKNISFSSGFGYVNLGFNNSNNYLKMASVSSVAGIIPVGDNSSFIFDSMVGVTQRKNTMYSGGFVDVNGNPVSGPEIYETGTEVAAFFMPGMRFQRKPRRAFQVALAGVIQWSDIGFYYGNSSRSRSFPIPMCSWFFKF